MPNDGACDWGLAKKNIDASCEVCAQYHDGRPDWKNEECVYVPDKSRCWPRNAARNKDYETEDCAGKKSVNELSKLYDF